MTDDDGPRTTKGRALVTGASGYVGGRLVPELLAAGWTVRAMARSTNRLRDAPWAGDVELAAADVMDGASLAPALADVDVAYYLVHSIGDAGFEDEDRRAATTFAEQAKAAGVRRIVYLGGLAPQGEVLSPHLRSREEVGKILLNSGVPTAVLRAAVVIGSGSASFEMLRHLTDRLPVMIVPKWVDTRIQPIAIRDVLRYLVGVADVPADVNRAFDIGGPDVLTYAEMMLRYAAAAGLPKRRMLRVPVLSPTLSSHWVGLITPVPGSLARPLVESLRNTVVCREHDIADHVPDPPDGLIGFDDAVRLALVRIRDADVATHWSNASVAGVPSDPMPTDPDWAQGTLYVDERSRRVDAPAGVLWGVIEGIGGTSGWYSWSWAWTVRGWIDRLFGGPGLRRGRRSPTDLRLGDALDFWRVEDIVDGELLRLRAEMRVPGRAWLDLGIIHDDDDGTLFHQRAVFAPKGLWVGRTGGRCTRSTGSSSAGCSATSPARPSGGPPGCHRPRRSARRPDRRRHRHDRRPSRHRAEPEAHRRHDVGQRTEVDAVPRRHDGIDAVAVGRPVELLAAGRRAAGPHTTQRDACHRIDDERPRRARGQGARNEPQHATQAVAPGDGQVGGQRPTGERQQCGRPAHGDRGDHDLVELVDAADVLGDLGRRRDQQPPAVRALDHGVGDRAERRHRPVTDDDARPAGRADPGDLAVETILASHTASELRTIRSVGWEQLHAGITLPIDPSITIPPLTRVELPQPDRTPVADVEGAARDVVVARFGDAVSAGMTVAVGAGSRGLTGRVELLRGAIAGLRDLGAAPFVVPAMGSHGGATAEGQLATLSKLGMTADAIGCEIRSSMETVVVAQDIRGRPLHLDVHAAGADRILPVNRMKPHTQFRGPIESGCTKMIVVGFGKQPGAAQFHSSGAVVMRDQLLEGVDALRDAGRILGGVASIEAPSGDVVTVAALDRRRGRRRRGGGADRGRTGPRGGAAVRRDRRPGHRGGRQGHLRHDAGSQRHRSLLGRPAARPRVAARVHMIVLLGLTSITAGNATGIGFVDFVPVSLAETIDWEQTYVNSFTAGGAGVRRGRMPMVLPDEESCIRAALQTCGRPWDVPKRVVRIHSTLHLTHCWVSDALLGELPEGVGIAAT